MSEPPAETPKRRCWLSLSLRSTLLLILTVGGMMGWKARRVSFQKKAVAAVERLGGSVIYDWETTGDDFERKPGARLAGPIWLRNILGDEYFQDVAQVSLPNERIPARQPYVDPEEYRAKYDRPYLDDQLACLDGLDRLKVLRLQCGCLKPEGWERLGRHARLKSLTVIGNPIDGDGQAHLGRLTELESLTVESNNGELSFLDRLPKLRSLEIRGPVTNAGLAVIGRRNRLKSLHVYGSKLTGLGSLIMLPKLKELMISNCHITDAAIEQFKAVRPKINVTIFH